MPRRVTCASRPASEATQSTSTRSSIPDRQGVKLLIDLTQSPGGQDDDALIKGVDGKRVPAVEVMLHTPTSPTSSRRAASTASRRRSVPGPIGVQIVTTITCFACIARRVTLDQPFNVKTRAPTSNCASVNGAVRRHRRGPHGVASDQPTQVEARSSSAALAHSAIQFDHRAVVGRRLVRQRACARPHHEIPADRGRGAFNRIGPHQRQLVTDVPLAGDPQR